MDVMWVSPKPDNPEDPEQLVKDLFTALLYEGGMFTNVINKTPSAVRLHVQSSLSRLAQRVQQQVEPFRVRLGWRLDRGGTMGSVLQALRVAHGQIMGTNLVLKLRDVNRRLLQTVKTVISCELAAHGTPPMHRSAQHLLAVRVTRALLSRDTSVWHPDSWLTDAVPAFARAPTEAERQALLALRRWAYDVRLLLERAGNRVFDWVSEKVEVGDEDEGGTGVDAEQAELTQQVGGGMEGLGSWVNCAHTCRSSTVAP